MCDAVGCCTDSSATNASECFCISANNFGSDWSRLVAKHKFLAGFHCLMLQYIVASYIITLFAAFLHKHFSIGLVYPLCSNGNLLILLLLSVFAVVPMVNFFHRSLNRSSVASRIRALISFIWMEYFTCLVKSTLKKLKSFCAYVYR